MSELKAAILLMMLEKDSVGNKNPRVRILVSKNDNNIIPEQYKDLDFLTLDLCWRFSGKTFINDSEINAELSFSGVKHNTKILLNSIHGCYWPNIKGNDDVIIWPSSGPNREDIIETVNEQKQNTNNKDTGKPKLRLVKLDD